MKIKANFQNGIINLPAQVASVLKNASRGDLAALFLLMSKSGGGEFEISDGELSEAGISRDELDNALSFWNDAGVIDADVPPKKNARGAKLDPDTSLHLTNSEASKVIGESPERLRLVDACQQTMGKIFNSAESGLILSLRECLGVGDDYILMLIAYAAEHGKKSVRYVEKMAYGLYERDITTADELEAYLCRLSAAEVAQGKYRQLVCGDGRALTKKEKDALDRWVNDYKFGFDMIELAYEKTVNATGKASLPYIDKILTRWHDEGIFTLDDAAADGARARTGANVGSFDTDDFFGMAVRRGLDIS
ncbi:MAG: DnaD domain protein [Clostridiales bacterium]|nr:DnaD domain protein [Clostridiales bacterium]